MTHHTMSLSDTLMVYSEWLDAEHLMASPPRSPDKDGQVLTHSDLAQYFLDFWHSDPHRATLAGLADHPQHTPSPSSPDLDQKLSDTLTELMDHNDPNIKLGAARMALDLKSVDASIRRDRDQDRDFKTNPALPLPDPDSDAPSLSLGVERMIAAGEILLASQLGTDAKKNKSKKGKR